MPLDVEPFCLIVPFGFVMIAMFLYALVRGQQRQKELRQLAKRWHLQFFPQHVAGEQRGFLANLFGGRTPAGPYGHIDDFRVGSSRKASNTLRGTVAGRDLWAGDWKYETGSGKSRRTHRFSYVLLSLPMPSPEVRVRTENFFDTISQSIGFNDLDFESVAFSDAYHVSAEDDRFAYALFHPPMIELFLRRRPDTARFGDGYLLLRGTGWSAGDLDHHMRLAGDILDTWPRHLLAGGRA